MTSQGYWAAVGLKLPTDTLYGKSLVILAEARHSGPLEAVESKWSDVVSGWMMALEQAKWPSARFPR